MIIETKEDFEREQQRLQEAYKILEELEEANASFWLDDSQWDTLQKAFNQGPANMTTLNIPLPILCAYFFAKQINFCKAMNTAAGKDSKELHEYHFNQNVEFDQFITLKRICEQWDGNVLIELESIIETYMTHFHPEIPKFIYDIWCVSFYGTYKKIGFAYEKYTQGGIIGDVLHPHHRMGNAALILEHLGKEYTTPPSLIEIQNRLVDEVLQFLKDKKFAFMTETRYTIAEILSFDKHSLFAWFIMNAIERVCPRTFSIAQIQLKEANEEEMIKLINKLQEEMKVTILEREVMKCINNTKNLRDDKAIIDYYISLLSQLKHIRGFTEVNILNWIISLQVIMTVYAHYRSILDKVHTQKIIQLDGSMLVRGMILGDSISVGVGLNSGSELNSNNQCYVKILPRLLEQHNIKLDIVNCSVIGNSTEHGKHIIHREIEAMRPNFVLICLGGNDVLMNSTINTVQNNIEEMLSICLVKNIKVIVALGLPQTFKLKSEYINEFSKILEFLERKYWIETIWIPPDLLHADNIQEDGVHFKESVQFPLAELASRSILSACLDMSATEAYREAASALKHILEIKCTELVLHYYKASYNRKTEIEELKAHLEIKDKKAVLDIKDTKAIQEVRNTKPTLEIKNTRKDSEERNVEEIVDITLDIYKDVLTPNYTSRSAYRRLRFISPKGRERSPLNFTIERSRTPTSTHNITNDSNIRHGFFDYN